MIKQITIKGFRFKLYSLLFLLNFSIMLFFPVGAQIISKQFSDEYLDLIRNKKVQNQWWLKCIKVQHSNSSKLIHMEFIQSVNKSTMPKEDLYIPRQQQIKDQHQFTYIEIIVIIAEEIWKVVLQYWELAIKMYQKEENFQPVQYEDNFASINGGAIILKKSSNRIHSAQSILQENIDKYLYSDEKLPIEIIIALKEEVKISKIRIKSCEIYSSTVKDFTLEGAFALNQYQDSSTHLQDSQTHQKKWFKILQAKAKNNGEEQTFRTINKVVRFLKLTITSKYGNWKYFTMTQIKVYGSGLFAEVLFDYQQESSKKEEKQAPIQNTQLSHELQSIYKQLYHFNETHGKKNQQNILRVLFEQVQRIAKVEEFHIFYMHNLTKKIENIAKVQREDNNNNFYKILLQKQSSKNTNKIIFLQKKIKLYEQQIKKMQQQYKKKNEQLKRYISLQHQNYSYSDNAFHFDQKQNDTNSTIIIAVSISSIISILLVGIGITVLYMAKLKDIPKKQQNSPSSRVQRKQSKKNQK